MELSERLKAVKPSYWYDVSGEGTVFDLYIDHAFEGRVQKHLARDERLWSRRFSVDGDAHGFSDDLSSAQALLLREIHDGAGRTVPVFDSLEEKRQRIHDLEARLRNAEADTERLDWLQGQIGTVSLSFVGSTIFLYWKRLRNGPVEEHMGQSLREAIDAAMLARPLEPDRGGVRETGGR